MPVKGGYLAAAGGGLILLWSGVKGHKWSTTLRDVLSGQPVAETQELAITSSPAAFNTGGSPAISPGGSPGGTLKYAAVAALWVTAGGPPGAARVAAAIAQAESGLSNVIQKGQPPHLTGWGLWQITPTSGISQNGKFGNLLNPLNNARAAVFLYHGAGNSFSPWVTYNDGAYRQFLR